MKSYKDLEIYKRSYDLALKVHDLTMKLPKHELYEEGSQARRSSKGITSCIVEGYGRKRYKAEFIKFLVYAHAKPFVTWALFVISIILTMRLILWQNMKSSALRSIGF